MSRIINGRYRLRDAETRAGGFSDVFKAIDLDTEALETVAIKMLRLGVHPDAVANMAVAREFEALERLRHPNIVGLIEAGVDDESRERFLALEWVDSSMDAYLDAGLAEPDEFMSGIGMKVSAAMAYAHENAVAHRDLKPSNVLLTAAGDVRIADFGISRLIDIVEVRPAGLAPTLVSYASPPYAPPEREAAPLTRDVWGLGSTLLSGLVRRRLLDYDDLRAAKDELDVVPELGEIVLRCVAETPSSRPADCRVVDAELRQFWRRREARSLERISVFIGVSRTAANAMDASDSDAAARMVAADLRETPTIMVARNARGDERQYQILGESRLYRVARDISRDQLPRMVVVTSYEPTTSETDRIRDHGLALEYVDFKAGVPADRVRAQDALDRLLENAEEHEVTVQANRRESEAARLLDQWRRQIEARSKIEDVRERPLAYSRVRHKDRRAVFSVRGSVDGVEVGEIRRAISTAGARVFVRGEVEDVKGSEITLYLDEGVEGIPSDGKLVIDTQPSRVKIQRERQAVDVLAHAPGQAARPDLAPLLFNPGSCRLPQPAEVTEWVSKNLDARKREAVQAALGSPDIYLVQGPPGTGKTTFIAELVAQQLRGNPRSRILISSQTNVALDNALDRIDRSHGGDEPPTIIRLADPRHGKVGPDAERFRVEGQLRAWRRKAEVRSNAFLEAWVEGRGMSVGAVNESRFLREIAVFLELLAEADVELERLALRYDRDNSDADVEPLSEEELDEHLQATYDRIADTESQLTRFQQANKGLVKKYQSLLDERDRVKAREMADALLGGTDAAEELRRLVQLQAEWMQRLGRGEGFIAALAQDSAVVGATCIGLAAVQELAESQFDLCIIDECSKATATETIVPMVRAKKWVLVGDEKQLPAMVEDALKDSGIISEFELDAAELQTTLFSRLSQGLPGGCQIMLTAQHRMVKPIGELISECFYGGGLESVGPTTAEAIPGVLPKPVTWHDTTRVKERFEIKPAEHQHSYVNPTEAKCAVDLVRRLSEHFVPAAEKVNVLVIAPYMAQVQELRRRVRQLGDLPSLNVEVATVDSVQGREAAYVIFSVTRSNQRGDAGFLRLDARANVALSRAKSGLAIVGDLSFCRTTDSPFRDVAHHVTSNPQDCARMDVAR